MCTVVNKNKSTFDVYIGRGSKWGNPYPINLEKGHSREVVIELYKTWIGTMIDCNRITIDDLLSLDGKRLGCYCKPKPCHGDVLVELVKIAKELKNNDF